MTTTHSLPVALFSSCCVEFDIAGNILLPLTSVEAIPEQSSLQLIEEVVAYPWQIDTKYYTADVLLGIANGPTIGNQQFAENVEALGLFFNPEDEFSKVNTWKSYIDTLEPTVLFLICNNISDSSKTSRQKVLEWCIKNQFELVELAPITSENSDEEEEEDDFVDSFGVQRIKQALFAHTWPNLILKDNPQIRSPYMEELIAEERHDIVANGHDSADGIIEEPKIDISAFSAAAHNDLDSAAEQEQSELLSQINGAIADGDTEEDLFSKMKVYMNIVDKYDVGSDERRKMASDAIADLCTNFGLLDGFSDSDED